MGKYFAEKDTYGDVRRIRFEGSRSEAARLADLPGASQSKTPGVVRFPPDEATLNDALNLVGGELTPEVAQWYEARLRMVNFALDNWQLKDLDLPELDAMLPKPLRAYQKVDLRFMVHADKNSVNPHVLNTNDVGLGKSVESILACFLLRAEKVLIVCSKSKVLEWADEIHYWLGKDVTVNAAGAYGQRVERERMLYAYREGYLIITYGMLRVYDHKASAKKRKIVLEEFPVIRDVDWDVVIFDEAHRLKGRDACQTEGAMRLKTRKIIHCTASPMLNRPDEIWVLLHMMDPYRFPSYWAFVEEFCEIERTPWANKIVGVRKEKVQMLRYKLLPYIIRHGKEELPELPPVQEKTVRVRLDERQRRMYDTLENELMVHVEGGHTVYAPSTVALIVRLRQLCSTPALLGGVDVSAKTEAVMDIVEEALDAGIKVVVFTWHKDYAANLHEHFLKRKWRSVIFTGDQSAVARHEAQMALQQGDAQVIVGTIAAMGEGINLQAANMVVFAEKHWVPKVNEQAWGRVHRQGVQGMVLVVSIVCEDTIEEYMERVLARKSGEINLVMAMEETVKMLIEERRKRNA